jgi:desulfoferrodoxin (superoxide reductase-like protein)
MKRKNHIMAMTIAVLTLTMVFFIGARPDAWAHPPDSIDLTYDKGSENLQIVVNHVSSNNSNEHYIRGIKVYVNGQEVDKKQFSHQTSRTQLIYDVKISAKENDKILVEATCARGGKGETTLTVPGDQAK